MMQTHIGLRDFGAMLLIIVQYSRRKPKTFYCTVHQATEDLRLKMKVATFLILLILGWKKAGSFLYSGFYQLAVGTYKHVLLLHSVQYSDNLFKDLRQYDRSIMMQVH